MKKFKVSRNESDSAVLEKNMVVFKVDNEDQRPTPVFCVVDNLSLFCPPNV